MAEEFQAAVCDGSWWISPRTTYNNSSCSSDLIHMKSNSNDQYSDMFPDSAFQMMADIVYPDSPTDWNQNLLLVEEEMNDFVTTDDRGLKAEIEAEHHDFATCSSGYPSCLVETLLNNNSLPLYDCHLNSNNHFSSGLASSIDFLHVKHVKPNHQQIRDLGLSATKSTEELLPFKRPRLETPSPLPSFKVRKEKLGDRITALQQLVSPFGKTDTASVLHEAIDYIKLLHDQVNILSAPYLKGAIKQLQHVHEEVEDEERHIQDLRSQGLCLVPVSSMFPVTTKMATGFWTSS
ncbi:hypothetical protein QVD17_19939 [Tagetes erecta]|uniref:BHLH domain-containing protein n=1 Tax=Tagetes erecta TaxID=13708 RepID=A0AAD8NXR2_TARER|nr:hypothetical protein QVD17_19939 [Tagetes erecta]